MHVVFVCTEYPPGPHGGTGSSYYDLACGLVRHGHRASVLLVGIDSVNPDIPPDRFEEGVRIIRHPVRFPWLRYRGESLARRWVLRQTILRLHAQGRVDVVEASDYEGWLPPGLPRAIQSVVRIRGANLYFDTLLGRKGESWTHRLERSALRRAGTLGAVSRFAAAETLRVAGLDRAVSLLPNGVDAECFHPPDPGEGVPGRVVFVGTTSPKKGLRETLHAFGQVAPAHPGSELFVAGSEAVGHLAAELLEFVPGELRSRVRFLGRLHRPALSELLRTAAVCCMPSHLETFGIAGVEAMACGRPVILSRTGPGPEILDEGTEGMLCDPHNPGDIARALDRLLADRTLAESLGGAARQRVLRDYALPGWLKRNEAFYSALIGRVR